MEAKDRPWPTRLLRYLLSVAIVMAITLALTGLVCKGVGWTTPVIYGKALFGAGLLVIFLGVWRFFGHTSAVRGPGGAVWDQAYASHHPFQFAAGLWSEINRSLDYVTFSVVAGVGVMSIGVASVSPFTSCLWCTLF